MDVSFPVHSRARALLAALGFFALSAATRAAPAEELGGIQKAAAELARTRAETVRVNADWQAEREILATTLDALKEQVRLLKQRQEILQSQMASQENSLSGMEVRLEEARRAMDDADARLRVLSERLVSMRRWLPPRLERAVDLPLKSLEAPSLSPGERMQYISTVMARCIEFNRTITFSEEGVELPGQGEPRLLEVLYWGMSQAYALERGERRAFLGRPGVDGWVWEEEAGAYGAIDRMIAMRRDMSDPEFVSVPAELSDPGMTAGGRP